jgi:DNA repair exonuclease SbcCD ATPase subunit
MNILLRRLSAHNFKHLQEIDLELPANGSVLIEGPNEAGKSTLFEAVFFALYGRPLLNDQDFRIEYLRGYGQEEMRVDLELTIDGRPFSISRRFGRSHTAKLTCLDAEGQPQTVTAQREIKQRLLQEMRLGPDALLNTCFVEQKKLDKLESLDKNARRDTINELLNLQVLTDLETQFKETREDTDRLKARQQRVDIARIDSEIPERESEAAAARRCTLNTEAMDIASEIDRLALQIADAESRALEISSRRAHIERELAAFGALGSKLTAVETDLMHRARAWEAAIVAASETTEKLEELKSLAESLPARELELTVLQGLRDRLGELEETEARLVAARGALDECRRRLARIYDLQAQLDDHRGDLHTRRESLNRARQTAALARTRDALGAWIQAAERREEADPAERLPDVARRQEDAGRRAEEAGRRAVASSRRALVGYAALAGGVLALLAGLGASLLGPFSVLAAIALAVGVGLIVKSRTAVAAAREDESQARSEHDRLAGERQAVETSGRARAEHAETWARREGECRTALEALGEPAPANPAAARVRMAEIDAPATAVAEQDERQAIDAEMKADNALALAQKLLEAEQDARNAAGPSALEIDIARLESNLGPFEDVRPALASRDLPAVSSELSTHVALQEQVVEQDRQTLTGLDAARERAAGSAAAVSAKARELGAAWRTLEAADPPPSPAAALARLTALARDLRAQLAETDEPSLRAEDGRLRSAEVDLVGKLSAARQESARQAREEHRLRKELAAAEGEALAALHAPMEDLRSAAQHSVAEWNAITEARRDAVKELAASRRAYAQPLGLDEEPLDLDAEQKALAAEDRRIQVKRRAGEVVARTRRSIVDRVMPLTLANVRRLLPLLTEGRYQDVQWHEESNVLEVYDIRARAYQRKRVFSGGAKDQISLALRLAFALATLPGEHAVQPGWLVLDEPLSSFDRDRTRALVDLITRGLIRKQFPQIFLVSHSESFDPSHFDHRLRLEHGRIVESSLPSTTPALAVVAAPAAGAAAPA